MAKPTNTPRKASGWKFSRFVQPTAGCSRYVPAPIRASHSDPNRLRPYRNTGMAPAAIAADCAVNMIHAPGAIQ